MIVHFWEQIHEVSIEFAQQRLFVHVASRHITSLAELWLFNRSRDGLKPLMLWTFALMPYIRRVRGKIDALGNSLSPSVRLGHIFLSKGVLVVLHR